MNQDFVIQDLMNGVSELIKTAETKMRVNGYIRPVNYQNLNWSMYGNQMRICYGQEKTRPLGDCPFDIRAAEFENIPQLIDAARLEMNSFLSKVDPEKVQKVLDEIG